MRRMFHDGTRRTFDDLPQTGDPVRTARREDDLQRIVSGDARRRRVRDEDSSDIAQIMARLDNIEQAIAILAAPDDAEDPNPDGYGDDDPRERRDDDNDDPGSLERQVLEAHQSRDRRRTHDRVNPFPRRDNEIRQINSANRKYYGRS